MRRQGFTLIELLIVVAIIAILAAIAVPNFLEAQTRSKISRAKNDLRTCAVAIESYRTDGNDIPPDYDDGDTNIPSPVYLGFESDLKPDPNDSAATALARLRYRAYPNWTAFTTPIAYMNRVQIDAFSKVVPLSYTSYTFRSGYGPTDKRAFALISSAGPDRTIQKAGSDYPNKVYDASNGTTSGGDLYRCAALADIGYARQSFVLGPNFNPDPQ